MMLLRCGALRALLLVPTRTGCKKFLITFDDGDEIWTGLPAKDVRPATSDLATAGGISGDGVAVFVVRLYVTLYVCYSRILKGCARGCACVCLLL